MWVIFLRSIVLVIVVVSVCVRVQDCIGHKLVFILCSHIFFLTYVT